MSLGSIRKVAILGGARIPFARQNTAYAELSNRDMLSGALAALVTKHGLQGECLGEVAAGAVLKHSRDFNLARDAVLGAGLAPETPAYDLQRACGTGLEAAIHIGNKIALGQIDAGIAAGVDTSSDAPIGVHEGFRKLLLAANRAKTPGARLKALAGFRPGMLVPSLPAMADARTGLSMGEHCEQMIQEWQIGRAEQDQLACDSHRKAARARDEGFFDGIVVPFNGLAQDNNLRPDTTPEKLSTLKPVFDRSERGSITAGNATPLTDGASAVLLGSEDWGRARGLRPQAYLTHCQTAAVDYVGGKDGLLMAPVYAVPRMLQRAGLRLQDFDYYEIHEAFAGLVLCTLKAWESPQFCRERLGLAQPLGAIDRSKLNVKGSSLAFGHPFAATGGRIVATAAKLLEQKGGGRCLISICAAGGLGVVAIVER